jgi:uncharacterized protein YbjQ (UPF0145 family)
MAEGVLVLLGLGLQFGLPLLLLGVTWAIGSYLEGQHYKSIFAREEATRAMPVATLRRPPADWTIEEAGAVAGSVVISLDHFKRFLAMLRAIFGGRIRAYEPLLDRARREALLRMKADAAARGFDAVFNVRLQTSTLASGRGNGKGVAGVEVLAFGTGLRRRA